MFILVALATAAGPGCAGTNFSDLRQGIEERGHYIENVPFYRQGDSDCGPAALASVLAFRGRPMSMEAITAGVYLPQLRGTLPMDMERFARERGFATMSSSGTLDRLRAHVCDGNPVICLIDLGFGPYRQPHYVTVIGFDDVHAVLVMHDGFSQNRLMPYDKFDRVWSKAGRWMLVVADGPGGKNGAP